MSRERRSTAVLAGTIRGPLTFEILGELMPSEASLQRWSITTTTHGDMVTLPPERDLIARLETKLVSQLLGDDNLPFCPNPGSHTRR